jgi:Uma2 family endonuclease
MSKALRPAFDERRYNLMTADVFLAMVFPDHLKPELDQGHYIRMMAAETEQHAAVSSNLIIALGTKLHGSGCRPYGSDFGVRTDDYSVRYPDISVFCGKGPDQTTGRLACDDPKLIVEVLSPSTSVYDQTIKLAEYKLVSSLETILYIDPETQRMRVLHRTGPEGWHDEWLAPPTDLTLPSLGITFSHADIFASL